MLIDDITIRIKAGDGGNGMVAFNGNKMGLGPTGARGGNGGNVYFEGIADLGALNTLKNKKVFKAEDGRIGGRQLNDGPAGKDITINVPVGTIIHNLVTNEKSEIIKIGERVLGAKGGNGGKGNFHFRGPRNTSPKQFQYGKPGEEFNIRLELKLIADVGLIGLPNGGKSSLLNELTRAKSKVANYAFTTLQPHLGVYYDLVLADIPGLIEGASTGKGLGVKFLRHVERTHILFHLVSAESEDPVKDYKSIRKELGAYNELLLDKEEYLFLSKSDLIPPAEATKKLGKLKKVNPNAHLLSIHDTKAIELVQKILNKIADNKKI
ncbi:MAG: GTPase ObgE [Candidatus Paceibacterota bacterium]